MNRSSPVPAVVMQPHNMMLPPRHTCFGTPHQGVTTHAGHHLSQTSLPSTHPTTGLGFSNPCSWPGCLQQTVCRIICEPASEEASFWDCGHANRLVAVCGTWSEQWQTDLPLLQPLKQCWQYSCVYFFKPASASDAQHKDSTSLIDPCETCSEWNHLGKPLYDPGHCTVTQFQAVAKLLIA